MSIADQKRSRKHNFSKDFVNVIDSFLVVNEPFHRADQQPGDGDN